MAAKEEDGNDGVLGELREIAELLQDIISQDEVESNLGDHDVGGKGGENKLNSDETSNEQGTSNQLAGLSTTYNVLCAYKKSNLANLETRNVPVSSGEAVPLSSSSDLTNVEIKRVPISSGKKAPLQRPPPTRMFSPSGPLIADVVKRSLGLSLKPIKNDPSLHGKSFAIREQLGDSDLASKYNLPDDEEVTNPIDYSSSDYDAVRYQPQEHFSLLSIENDNSKEFADDVSLKQYMSKIDASSSDHLDSHEPASGFIFDVRQPVNPAQATPQPSLQRQNAMHQQRYRSELDLGYLASSLNQPMPTRDSITPASSPGHRPSISMTKALTTATDFVPKRNQQQAMNQQYSQCQVPTGQYGNMTNSSYTPTNQTESYNMAQSAAPFQQQGGSNMAHNGNVMTSPYWRPEQNDSYNMPQLPASAAPYAYGSVKIFGTSSDNAANSRFGYEGGVSSNNNLSSVQQYQSGDSNVWPPSSRRSQQQRQQQLWSEIFAARNQHNVRSHDPSDQTQQRLWPRGN